MPLYEYECRACGDFEASQVMARATEPAACPRCGKPSRRILSASAIGGGGTSPRRRRRGKVEPRLVEVRPGADRPPPKPRNVVAHGRPWMFGH